jgi:hypothetical protein
MVTPVFLCHCEPRKGEAISRLADETGRKENTVLSEIASAVKTAASQ